uniref:hypothetical protein n=2 Tax=Yoonia sp. TaxID=2212373 RepID=UPI004047CF6F
MIRQPEFRVRVFLSVDLVGSTVYKSVQDDNSWIQTFRKFYAEFLSKFKKNYVAYCEQHAECASYQEEYPSLWKTIGDEAIFVNKVDSLYQLFAYVHAFDVTLHEYQTVLHTNPPTRNLDVKGNGWIASFPFPNQTISKPNFESDSVDSALPDEDDEREADKKPSDYDFLGSGIDAGFRIARNSTSSFMSLSPVLAVLLVNANINNMLKAFEFDFCFLGTNELKGVLKAAKYPIVGIRTERDTDKIALENLSGQLTGANKMNPKKLHNYLQTFIRHHEVDMPQYQEAKGAGFKFTAPKSYNEKFAPYWEKLRKDLASADETRTGGEEKSADDQKPPKKRAEGWKAVEEALIKIAELQAKNKNP